MRHTGTLCEQVRDRSITQKMSREIMTDTIDLLQGPREISILDKAAIPLIYGPNSECRKASWYTQGGNDPTKCAVNMIRDGRTYRLRRRAWDRGLANKGMYVEKFVRRKLKSIQP
jgi:hypothetical protein